MFLIPNDLAQLLIAARLKKSGIVQRGKDAICHLYL